MKNNKIKKIYEVINENGRTLNLHEIKAMTGVGNGYNNLGGNATPVVSTTHKDEKIYDAVTNIRGNLNLHEIKAKTGAGNGYKHSNIVNIINNISDNIAETYKHKSHKINELINNADRSLNLHQIKALTGAGSGYRQ